MLRDGSYIEAKALTREMSLMPLRRKLSKIQGRIHIDVHIQVPGKLTVLEGHQISSMAEHRIKQTVSNVADVLIHIEPVEDDKQD